MQNKLFKFTSETKKFSFFSMPLIPKGVIRGSPLGASLLSSPGALPLGIRSQGQSPLHSPLPRELLTFNAGSIQGILSRGPDCCPYSSRKSLLNCKFTLCKNNNSSYRRILIQQIALTFYPPKGDEFILKGGTKGDQIYVPYIQWTTRTLKTKIQVMSRQYLIPKTLISFHKKALFVWYFAIFSFYLHYKINSHSMRRNIHSIKAIKKALSQLYVIRKSFESNFNTLCYVRGYVRGIASYLKKSGAFPLTFLAPDILIPFRGIGVPAPLGLEVSSGTPTQLRRQYKQDSKQLFTKFLLFLKKETLKKSYQTPAVIITKLNQQLHSTSLKAPNLPNHRLGRHKCGQSPHFEDISASVPLALNISRKYYYLAYPNYSKKEANSSDTFILMNKSIKKLIWTMLKKQYSNISLSLIANRNWFFLLVKNLTKINLFNRQEYGPHPFGGKNQKSDSFQQMSFFFALSLVPFKYLSLNKGKNCLVQINGSFLFWSKKSMVYKKIEQDFLSNCIFDPRNILQVETRDFNLLFKGVFISPIQSASVLLALMSSKGQWNWPLCLPNQRLGRLGANAPGNKNFFCMTVKSEVRLINLECSLFLKRNLYTNSMPEDIYSPPFKGGSTFLYTHQQIHKKEKSFPSGTEQQKITGQTRQQLLYMPYGGITSNLQINPLKENKNGIRKSYLLGITHYLDSSKRKQSVLKKSQLFEQFSVSSYKFVISKLYYLGGILFTFLGNSRYPLTFKNLCPLGGKNMLSASGTLALLSSKCGLRPHLCLPNQRLGRLGAFAPGHKGELKGKKPLTFIYIYPPLGDRGKYVKCQCSTGTYVFRGVRPWKLRGKAPGIESNKCQCSTDTCSFPIRDWEGTSVGRAHTLKKPIVQNKKQNYPISPFKNNFLFQLSYQRIKSKKKQKALYIWKNQNQVTSFCHYSF